MAAQSDNPPCFIRIKQVKQRTGLGRSTLYSMIAQGQFPRPISLGARAVGWLDYEVQNWVNDRVRASRREPSEAAR
jgi:prophage regulatory protein